MKKSAAISIVILGALIGAYLSVVVAGEWVDEHKYVYSSPLDYALDYLSDDIYRNIAIEVDWVTGCEPDWNAFSFLIEKIREYCEKDRVYIDFNVSDEILPLRTTYTLDALISIEHQYRNLYKNGDTAVIYFLYLNGKYIDTGGYSGISTEVVGLTYSHSSIAIFKDELRKTVDAHLDENTVEKSVLLHEFGHLICLVGIGYHADHEDPEHPHHTIHPDGVMYYAINVSEGAPPPPLDFCNDSKKDIEFIKSRSRDISNIIYIPWLLLTADVMSALAITASILSPEDKKEIVPNRMEEEYEYYGEQDDENMYF